jgi:two-component system cell cycle response regulator CpdR
MARILLAEDDSSLRRFLTRALQRAGHEVAAVGRGSAALPLLNQDPYDLLLTDIVMPGMDGIELAEEASKIVPGMRVMFITGFAAVALNRKDESLTGVKVLSKPFHLRDLVEEIDRVLAA